jgi:competence protein ComEA
MSEWLERNRQFILFSLFNLLSVGVLFCWFERPRPTPLHIETPTVAPTPTEAPIQVHVCGAVAHADVYALQADAIVKDALWAAGGPTESADLNRVNLALPVHDGDQVYIPTQNEESISSDVAPSNTSRRTRINHASAAELQVLPGIGATYAERIVAYRQENGPFKTIEDLIQVRGIGPATLEQIRDKITVR